MHARPRPSTGPSPESDLAAATAFASRPTFVVRAFMKPMTRLFNPVIRKAAGRRHVTFAARVQHHGRWSGRAYATPVSARLDGDGRFWVPLTFGTGSDWCRNVLAAGGCTIRWKGREYAVTDPVLVPRAEALRTARSSFLAPERAMLRLLGISQFLRLSVAPAESTARGAGATS
jgi:deazaflavin-dependent oxidoreductase (nitroreductase family)